MIDYVRYWSERAPLPKSSLIDWLGIGRAKFYGWRRRPRCLKKILARRRRATH